MTYALVLIVMTYQGGLAMTTFQGYPDLVTCNLAREDFKIQATEFNAAVIGNSRYGAHTLCISVPPKGK